jgi:hypothetical protein
MKIIPLTKGHAAIVDDVDYERVSAFKWTAAIREHKVYAFRSIRKAGKRLTEYLHRGSSQMSKTPRLK